MKQVLVETNFLIEVTRPAPGRAARSLLARARQGQLQLHLPWCSISEARRTLPAKIKEDLDFHAQLERMAGLRWTDEGPFPEKSAIDSFVVYLTGRFQDAMGRCNASIDAVAADCRRIDPTQDVLNRLLAVYPVKSQKPFDEMVLAAVLQRASELRARGEQEIVFCNVNKQDFSPSKDPVLRDSYLRCGIQFQDNFVVH